MNLVSVAPTKAKKSLDESMIPAINIVFLLLIFFMIAGHIEATNNQLTIPASTSESDPKTQEVKIELIADGSFLINGAAANQALDEAIKGLGLSADSSVICYVHRDLPASSLDPVLKVIRQLGIKRLHLATTLQS